jgi:hypothetical protein
MSLRIRLICLIALVLVLSLAVEGTIVSFNASRSVSTEMNSALQVGQQIVKSALAGLPESPDPREASKIWWPRSRATGIFACP